MAGIFTSGGNPFGQDPMQLLSTMAAPGQDTPPAAVSPVSAAASIPSNGTDPGSASSGGFDLGSITGRIGDAFSGKGAFGGSADDNEIDPMTGAPKGLARQANGRSMLQLGLTFLLAGQRMSGDQRAAILSKAPGLVGGSDDSLNSFAKTRLEMAKLRMEQQKMQDERASSQALMRGLGLDGGSTDAAPAPSAGAQGVQAGQQALAQAAPVVDPSQATAPAGAPSPAMPDPAQAQAPAPAPAPASIAAPGGVPRMSGAGAGFDPKSLTQAEKLAIVSQPTTAGKSQMFGQIVQARAAGERIGDPQYNSVTGTIQYPKYNGRNEQTGFADGGKPITQTEDTDKHRIEFFVNPKTGEKVITKRTDLGEDQAAVREQTLNASILKPQADTIKTTYKDNIAPAVQRYDTLGKVREDVLAGKGVFGTGATTATQVIRGLSTAGLINPKFADDLMTNQDFLRASKDSVANVIKNFNGSQAVSDSDRKFAVEVVGASLNGTRDEVLNSITNNMKDIRNSIKNYNESAADHNSQIGGMPQSTQGLLKAKTVDKDFDRPELDYMERYQQRRADMQAKYDGTPAKAASAPKAEGARTVVRDPKTGKLRFE